MEILVELLSNKILVCSAAAFLVSGFLKVFFHYVQTKVFMPRMVFMTGGMPSSHTAFITGATTSIYFVEGITNLFALCAVINALVIADAIGIRRAVGKQAFLINRIAKEAMDKKVKPEKLYELLGHSPFQALVGLVIGLVIPSIMFLLIFR